MIDEQQRFKFYLRSPPVDTNEYTDPKVIAKEFSHLSQLDQETVWILGLNSANKAILKDCIFKGGLDSSSCDRKLIFKRLLQAGCINFIMIHNHPSGFCNPSREDNKITKRLQKVAEIVGITFLDHIIIADDGFYSYSQKRGF